MPADRLSGAPTLNGRYRLVEPLGSGGMGTVWVAHDEVLGRDVAVKELVLPPSADPSERDELLQRALREARTAAQIDHPNVVRVFDVVEHDDRPWIVMELVRARSLAQRLRESGPLPPAEAAHLGLELLKGLDAAHRAGVVHRDVKPGNVLLGDDGRVLLTDFGVSAREGDSTLTRTGMLVGSPAYISPERARGHAVPASDLWALGATLFAAVEGRSPFERAEPIAALTAALTEPAPPAEHAGPALQAAIDRLLDKDPEQRADTGTARALLERAAVSESERSTAPVVPGDLGDRTQVLDVPPPVTEQPRGEGAQRHEAAGAAGAGAAGVAAGAAAAAAAADRDPGADGGPGAAGAERARGAGAPESRQRGEAPARSAPPASPRRGGGPRSGVLVALAVALVVLVGAAAVAILSGRDTGGRGSATGPSGASGSAPPSTGPSSPAPSSPAASTPAPSSPAPSTPPPSSSAPSPTSPSAASSGPSAAVPAGYRRYTDSTGFSVAVPDGWKPKHHDGVVDLQDPNGSRYLRIGQTDSPKPDPVADWKNQEKSVSQRLPGYQRIRIDPVDYRGWKAADWEFTFRPSKGSTIHVLDRGFVTGPKGYALYMSAPDAAWSDAKKVFDVAAATFTPAG